MACTRHGSCYPAWQGSRSGPTVTLLLSGLCSRRCLLHATLNMFSVTGPILHQSALLDPLQVGCVSDQAVLPTHPHMPPTLTMPGSVSSVCGAVQDPSDEPVWRQLLQYHSTHGAPAEKSRAAAALAE